jgi:uncharacterized iron-regulated membrane protein
MANEPVKQTTHEALTWLHTWTGVGFAGLLFALFWMGTLSVYDREIDRWMMPVTRLDTATTSYSPDHAWKTTGAGASFSPYWEVAMPNSREPTVRVIYADEATVNAYANTQSPTGGVIPFPSERMPTTHINPETLEILPDPGTQAGTNFIFPFHWHLHLRDTVGQWIVGLAGMAMLVLIVSGVIIHRKIFTNFFTFKADRKAGRVLLDLHNVTGVLGLPFHFLITFSGLAIFFFLYFPGVTHTYEGGVGQFYSEVRETGGFRRTKANEPGELASLDAMAAKAEAAWGSGRVDTMRVLLPNDKNAYVQVSRSVDDTLALVSRVIFFDGATGEIVHQGSLGPVSTAQRVIAGLHFALFKHWTLRWIYFVLGLTGCVLIATGLMYWWEARRKLHRGDNFAGARFVDAMNVGAILGIIIATLAFFIVNRLGVFHRLDRHVRTWLDAQTRSLARSVLDHGGRRAASRRT